MPSFISLASEYVPHRIRPLLVTVLWAGFPLGGVVGGVLASVLIPTAGWQSIFYIGGIAPIVLAGALAVALPGIPRLSRRHQRAPRDDPPHHPPHNPASRQSKRPKPSN